MQRTDLDTIRRESFSRVLDILALHGELTRAQIAEMCEMSLMTVGKAIDRLGERRIILTRKSDENRAGRKSSLVALDKFTRLAIYDLSSFEPRLYVTDLAGRRIGEYDLTSPEAAIAQSMIDCIESESELSITGLILPNRSPEEALHRFRELTGSRPDIAEREIAVSALGASRRGEPLTLYLRDGEVPVGAILRDGAIDHGANRRACAIDELTGLLGGFETAVKAMMLTLDPNLIMIENGGADACESRTALCGELPDSGVAVETIAHDKNARLFGMAKLLRDKLIADDKPRLS